MAAVMFLRKAMRYYRLWIYTCNAVLLVSVFVFMGVAAGVVSHPYLSLVPTPPAYHPTLLYGYVALLLQAGILQALGCMGALRLSQKLLNIYWLLLLFLLLGDVVVGLVWLYRFSHLTEGLRPYARATLHNHYGRDPDITEAWDTLQSTSKCCGVVTPRDYNTTWWDIREQNLGSTKFLKLPASCCKVVDIESLGSGGSSPDTRKKPSYLSDQIARHPVTNYPRDAGSDAGKPITSTGGGGGKGLNATSVSHTRLATPSEKSGWPERNITCWGSSNTIPKEYYKVGCHAHLEKWFLNSTETLMILGFCVIAFIKLCFVGILRFEIQEMIQKIKVLQGETPCTPNPELAAALGLVPPEKAAECGLLSTGGGGGDGDGGGGTGGGGGDEGGGGDGPGDPDSPAATPLTQPRLNHLSGHTDGAESDTNSHCALITDTPIRRPQPDKRKPNGNNNDVTELRELRHIRQTQI